jgi:hypothetical protein
VTIMASAPVPTQCRLNQADTVRILPPVIPASSSCPTWCLWDSPDDGEGTFSHFSDVEVVNPTAGGWVERDPIDVSVDQDAATGDRSLIAGSGRVIVANLGPMTAAEALQLADLLVAAARRIGTSGQGR